MAVAQEGDTIHLTMGNYVPTGRTFEVNNSVTLIGGYDEAFSQKTQGTTFLSKKESGEVAYDNIDRTVLTVDNNPYGLIRIMEPSLTVAVENMKIQKGEVFSGNEDAKMNAFVSFCQRQLVVNATCLYEYALYDSAGNCICRGNGQPPRTPVTFWQFPSGFYVLRVKAGERQETVKTIFTD